MATETPVELEDWLGAYWDAGYNEGKTGANNADRANEALHNIRRIVREAIRAQADELERLRAQVAQAMTPAEVRDGIAEYIDTYTPHREFWTPEVVDLVRSIEINPRARTSSPAAPAQQAGQAPARAPEPVAFVNPASLEWLKSRQTQTNAFIETRLYLRENAEQGATAPVFSYPAVAHAQALTAMQARHVVGGMGWDLDPTEAEDMEMLVKAAERACAAAWGVKLENSHD